MLSKINHNKKVQFIFYTRFYPTAIVRYISQKITASIKKPAMNAGFYAINAGSYSV